MNDFKKSSSSNVSITPKRDIVFKRLFGSKGSEGILKDFLESILDIKIESLSLDLATELLPDFYDGKKSRIDVRAKLSDGTEVNIEVQSDVSKYSEERCLQYWSKIYSNNLQEGGEYTDLKKTICIWILDGSVYKEFEDFQSKWRIMNEKYRDLKRFQQLEFYIIELNKFRNSDIMKLNKLESIEMNSGRKDFWLWFIDHTNWELINMACEKNDKIKEAREQLEKIKADKELMEKIRLQELAEWDYNTGMARARREGIDEGKSIGLEEGKMNEKIITAKKMLTKNINIETIMELTELSREEIEKLK